MYRFVAILLTIPSPSSQLIYDPVSTSRVSPPSQDISPHLPLLVSATAGNVASPRPGIFDMLGRAKWWIFPLLRRAEAYTIPGTHGPNTRTWTLTRQNGDMWMLSLRSFFSRHAIYACSNLYQVLRKYSDKTMARDLVGELESYGGDPVNLVHSGTIICCFVVCHHVIKLSCRNVFEVPGL
jgi:hypothetical protein